ncbi:TonB-dependent receptor plug domain-containing protein [Myxococcota bacterium]
MSRSRIFILLLPQWVLTHSALAQVVELAPAHVETEEQQEESPDLGTGTASVVETGPLAGSGLSLADAVEEVPGVNVRRYGGVGNFTAVHIRGLGPQNVSVVLDDMPLASATAGPIDLSLYPLESLERIEVYRGGGPVRFQSPIGGMIRLVTHPPTRQTTLSAHAGYGSFDTRTAHLFAAGPAADLRYAAFVGYKGSAGDFAYFDDAATLYNPDDDSIRTRTNNGNDGVAVRLTAETDTPANSTLRFSANGIWRSQGIAGSGNQEISHTHADEAETSARLGITRATVWDGRLRLAGALDALLARRQFRDPGRELGLKVDGVWSRLLQVGIDGRAQLLETLSHETELSPRVSWTRFLQRGAGETSDIAPLRVETERLHVAVGLEHRADLLADLRMVPSVRFDTVRDSDDDSRETNTELSPRLGLLYYLGPCEVRANLGRFHRFPSLYERYGDGRLTAVPPSFALRPERGVSADVGGRCRPEVPLLRQLEGDLSGFATDATDLILARPQAQGLLEAINVGRSVILGIEASLSARHAWVRANVAYTLTHARDHSGRLGLDGNRTPGLPTHRVDGTLRAGPEWLSLTYEISVVSMTYLDQANLLPLPTRVLHALEARAQIPDTGLEVICTLRNLTNRISAEVELPGGVTGVSKVADFIGHPLPGRSLFVSLVWRST